jgi:hypothetical protein
MAVQALGMVPSHATNVISALERACLDPDRSVRQTATNGLKRYGF